MTTMVERVTAAIVDHFTNGNEQYESLSEYERILYTAAARAAIEAMMEPTPDVEIAVDLHCNFKPWEGDGKRAWQAGIQSALKEGQ